MTDLAPSDTPVQAPRGGRNLPAAIAVGLGLLALVGVSLFLVKELFVVLALAAVGASLWELAHAFARRGINLPLLPLVVGAAGILVSSYVAGEEALLVSLVLAAGGVVAWRAIDSGGLVALRDASAGVLFGRHPLAPSVSPKKTWEGLGGSVLLTCLVGAAGITWLLGGNPLVGVGLGLATVATATLGDLAESLIKRDLELKDMGTLLPGHGGVLDRLDSLLLTAPVVYLVLLAALPVGN